MPSRLHHHPFHRLLPFSLFLFLLLFYLPFALGQIPNFPHGGGNCTTDYDCSLSGTCLFPNHTCQCYSWTTGFNCNYLNFRPGNINDGLQIPNYHSWGGHAVYNESENLYHGYFSFMCDHSDLDGFETYSSVYHAISTLPNGPYVLHDLVAPPFSHNAMIATLPNATGYVLYQIGNAENPPSQWYPCYNSSEITEEYRSESHSSPPSPTNPLFFSGDYFYARISSSVYGPWIPYQNNTPLPVEFSNSWLTTASSGGNPAPVFLPNGTVLLYVSANPCPPNWGNISPYNNCIGVLKANAWDGPFLAANPLPVTKPESEDPFVFIDHQGYFHLVTNVNNDHTRCASGIPCGGHAWSYDGINFSNLTIGAFGPVIKLNNGSYWYNSYVERPQVYQDSTQTPITFFVGMGRTSYADCGTWAQQFCTPEDLEENICGPTLLPPPTAVQYKYKNSNLCISTNSTFPCPGGWGDSCPLFLDACTDSVTGKPILRTIWYENPNNIENADYPDNCLSVDCDYCNEHTVTKLYACHGASSITFNATSQQLLINDCPNNRMCLNNGNGPAIPPCKAGEEYLPNTQLQLANCTNPDTQGWERIVVDIPNEYYRQRYV